MWQPTLFNSDPLAFGNHISLDDIKKVSPVESFKWLQNHSTKIGLSAKPTFDFFMSANRLEPKDCPQYYCSPYWSEACNNYKWRYLIVEHKSIYYLVFLRIVGMFNQRYFSISYRILSSTGNNGDVSQVMDCLLKIDAIKEYEEIYEGDFESCENVNFYCDTDSVEISKNRRKKLHRANMFFDGIIEVRQIRAKDKTAFMNKVEQLYDIFQDLRFKFDMQSANRMLDIALNDEKCCVYAFFLYDILVGMQVVCNDFMNACSIHFAKDISTFPVENISSYVGIHKDDAQKIRNFLGTYQEEYIKHDIIINKHYDALFVDGFIKDSRNKMIAHKKGFYDKCIFYKIVKI